MLIPYSNIKKEYLQILKNLAQFFSHLFFQILKKHTYKSQNTPFHNNKYFKGNIKTIIQTNFIKTIIQMDKHKAKYIITACIPIIIVKKFLLFIKKFIII